MGYVSFQWKVLHVLNAKLYENKWNVSMNLFTNLIYLHSPCGFSSDNDTSSHRLRFIAVKIRSVLWSESSFWFPRYSRSATYVAISSYEDSIDLLIEMLKLFSPFGLRWHFNLSPWFEALEFDFPLWFCTFEEVFK